MFLSLTTNSFFQTNFAALLIRGVILVVLSAIFSKTFAAPLNVTTGNSPFDINANSPFDGGTIDSGCIVNINPVLGRLTNNSTFTLINSGNININAALINNGTIINTSTITNSGTLNNQAGSVLTSTGTITNTGTLDNQVGSTLQIGNGGATGAITGNIANGGSLVFDRSNPYIYAGDISGAGTIAQQGTGILTLSGNNTATSTNITAGTLTLIGNLTSAATINAGSTLQISNGGATGAITGNITNDGSLVFDRSNAYTYAGNISGAGTIIQQGSGELTLSGNNAATVTNVTAGTLTLTGNLTSAATINAVATLKIGNGGATGAIAGDINNGGSLVFDHSNAYMCVDNISGAGTITQQGTGILTLTGNNAATTTTINAGSTLQIGSGAATGTITSDITNGGSLIFDRSNAYIYTGNISGAGTITQRGTGTLTLTGNNTATTTTIIGGSTLQIGNGGATGTITGDITNGGSLVFDRSNAYTYAGDISGAGTINQQGAGILTLSGNNTATSTNITAGTLNLTGNLTSAVTIGATGSLTGNGGIVGTLNGSGTTISSRANGVISITGNTTFNNTHVFECELDANETVSTLNVTGNSTLDGQVKPVVLAGNYQLGRIYRYAILEATGAITNNYANNSIINPNSALYRIEFDATAPANTIGLTLEKISTLSSLAPDGNAYHIANAIENMNNAGALATALGNLSGPELNQALNKLGAAATATVSQDAAMRLFDSLQAGLGQNPHNSLQNSAASTAFQNLTNNHKTSVNSVLTAIESKTDYNKKINQRFEALPTRKELPKSFRTANGQTSFWINTAIKSSNMDKFTSPGTIIPEFGATTSHTQLGGDYQVTGQLLLGIMSGYSHTSYHQSEGYGGGDVNTYQLGAYGSFYATPQWYIDAVVNFGYSRLNGSRLVTFTGIDVKADQKHHANQWGGMMETGYNFALPYHFTLTPYAHVGTVYLNEGGYTETGADAYRLTVKKQGRTYVQSRTGAQLSKVLLNDEIQFYGFAKLAYTYQKALGNANKVSAAFVDQPTAFSVFSSKRPNNLVSPGMGLTTLFSNNIYITFGYNGDFGKNQRANEGYIQLGTKF